MIVTSVFNALRAMLCAALLVLCFQAEAQDRTVERTWFEDPTGHMSLAEVMERATPSMTPFTGALSRGFGTSTVWIRLRIDPGKRPAAMTADDLVLRVRPVYLDEIRVFDPLAPGGYAGVIGDHVHPRQDVMQGRDFLLPVARGDAPRDLWLRLASTSTRQIYAEVLSRNDLPPALLREDGVSSLHLGLVAIMVIWGLAGWLTQRDVLMGAFAIKELGALLFALSSLGFLRALWPLSWDALTLDKLGSAFGILSVSGALLFHVLFLAEFKPPRWSMAVLKGCLVLGLIDLAMVAMGSVTLALRLNMLAVLLGPFVSLFVVLSARAWQAPDPSLRPVLPRWIVIVFYVLILLLLLVASTTAFAWAQATAWTLYASQLHSLVTALLVMVMLQYRARMMQRRQQETLLALERSSMQVEHERKTREEQEKLLAMLAHEIKTPLATMHMRLDTRASGSREIRQAMRDMNGVIDRCIQSARMGDGRLAAKAELHDLAKIVRDAVSACAQPERVHVETPERMDVATDRQLLSIVLNNLLENACKYSAAGTPIELRIAVADDPDLGVAVRLEIRNRPGAAGFPDEALVFDKYYRSPQARRQTGTGLGLYLVKSLAATLGGRIEYRPEQGAGGYHICFVLTLPLAEQ